MSGRIPQTLQGRLTTDANNGNVEAATLIAMAKSATLVITPPSAGLAVVAGQIVDGLGGLAGDYEDVLVSAKYQSGPVVLNVPGGGGTVEYGADTDQLWFKTNPNGTFTLNVEDATPGELMLLVFQFSSGIVQSQTIQF